MADLCIATHILHLFSNINMHYTERKMDPHPHIIHNVLMGNILTSL